MNRRAPRNGRPRLDRPARRLRVDHERLLDTLVLELGDGSLLVMGGALQRHYTHRTARTKKSVGPRLSLTFRLIPTGRARRGTIGR